MSYITLLIYFLLCGAAYAAFRLLYKNRYISYYEVDEILDTNEESYVTYNSEDKYKKYIDSYSVYITDDYRFFKAHLTNFVEYINFDLICYKNKKIYKVCNILNEVRDKKEDFTIKIPDGVDEVKVRINEVNGLVFKNKELVKNDLLWRAIVSSLLTGILSVGLIFLYRILFNPSTNLYFDRNDIFTVLFKEPWNYAYGALLAFVMSFMFFSVIYFPNLLKVKRAKFNKIKKFKIKKIIKCKFKPNKKVEKEIIKVKIKGRKKFKTGTMHIIGYDKNGNITLDKTFGFKKKRKTYSIRTKGYVDNIAYEVISADFKKYYYEFSKFRIKQTKKGLEGKFLRLKGIGVATLIFTISIGVTTGSAIYEFTRIYQINNNMKHFVFDREENGNFKIIDYNGENNVIALPTMYQQNPVSKIAEGAFAGKQTIVEVLIPNNYEIGDAAFASCKWLKYASFGENIKIGANAFNGTHLRSVEFKNNETIRTGAFANIPTLRKVVLDGNISLESFAFQNSTIDYLEVHPAGFTLPTSAFYEAKVKKGYIFSGSTFSPSNIASYFAAKSNVKVENVCVHDKYSFIVRDGKIIDSYSYKDYEIKQQATCSSKGIKEVQCNYCGGHYFISTKIDPNNHSYINGICTQCGKKDPNYVPPATEEDLEGGNANAN